MAKGHGERLSRKQDLAIAALLAEPTLDRAAAKVGVNEKTLRAWLGDPAFRAAFRAAGRTVVTATLGRLQTLTAKAAAVLEQNLDAARPADQLRAVELVLTQVTRLGELCDLADELDALKRALAGGGDGGDAGDAPPGPGSPQARGGGAESEGPGDAGGAAG